MVGKLGSGAGEPGSPIPEGAKPPIPASMLRGGGLEEGG